MNSIHDTFPNGIQYYTSLSLEMLVHFPEGQATCQYCKLFCRYEENFKRYSCRITEEWLINPFKERGKFCPLNALKKGGMTYRDPCIDSRREREREEREPAEL